MVSTKEIINWILCWEVNEENDCNSDEDGLSVLELESEKEEDFETAAGWTSSDDSSDKDDIPDSSNKDDDIPLLNLEPEKEEDFEPMAGWTSSEEDDEKQMEEDD